MVSKQQSQLIMKILIVVVIILSILGIIAAVAFNKVELYNYILAQSTVIILSLVMLINQIK